MNTTDIIVVGSAGLDPDLLVVAACRAGGRGFLQAGAGVADIQRRSAKAYASTQRFGIAISELADANFLSALIKVLPPGLATILVPHSVCVAHRGLISEIRKQSVEILVELDNQSQFAEPIVGIDGAAATELIDGIVLKGNESGGRVSGTTAYILTQQWCEHRLSHSTAAELPFWVRGGIGIRSAAAALLAGATGVALDSQLLLARESQLSKFHRQFAGAMDGSESVAVGSQLGVEYRICTKPGSQVVAQLGNREDELAASDQTIIEKSQQWQQEVWQQYADSREQWPLFFCGPDLALAAELADEFTTVAGIMQGIAAGSRKLISLAATQDLLAPGSALAASHGTKYPILQGPMTRVSDVPEFADAVSAGGALPFLALALLRERQATEILAQSQSLLGDRSWGVGLLGFLPPEIRKEQIRAIKQHKPPFAIIAGGRPDQAKELEDDGIETYLHVPSPGLLSMFLRSGAKRFILEGRECGGHVGPRTSFMLWEQQIAVLEKHLRRARDADQYHLVFAGGIHDGRSAAMAVAMAAGLAAKGVQIGVLMGTAYLFTQEAVETGAIVGKFQQEVCQAEKTVLFETGPGHAVRCLETPYYHDFVGEKVRLKKAGKPHNDIVAALERMNIGRLRVASKGVDRRASEPGAPRQLVDVNETEQRDRGMYMVGQVASMQSEVTTISALHERISDDAAATFRKASPRISVTEGPAKPSPCDVAIVGMSCFYPGANSLREYWDNILHRVYAVTEIPGSHWDYSLYYDENPLAKDKIVSKWGGFLGDIPFDPLQYGITPKSIQSIEPLQLLLLEAMSHTLEDAGYRRRPFDRENSCAVLGIGGGGSPMGVAYGFRTCLPLLRTAAGTENPPDELIAACEKILPEWTEDSFPGFLMNVAVGRVANRFDLGGSNYAIDAACASSLAAVHGCIRELELGTANVAFAMGADTVQTPYSYMAFSKTHALSPRGRCRPFDASADGIVLSEGIGVVMLKRLADAERDGDKIYSVIRGIGSSSDGKDKGLTAPNAAGQIRALRRAYEKAGISPSQVGLVEAHGTGTVVGDRTESLALATVMSEGHDALQTCALGSVKSMIGHSKCAAGVAGLIKGAMALHHKVLPPTLVETPNPTANYDETALYLNTESRPWINDRDHPRTAGISAFGFGGTNVHLVMEEYTGAYVDSQESAIHRWPTELFVYREASVEALVKSVESAISALDAGASVESVDYAASLWNHASTKDGPVLAIVAESTQQLREHLARASKMIHEAGQSKATNLKLVDPRGIYFAASPAQESGKVAVLFPGQGSQYPNMLADVAIAFPAVRDSLDAFASAPLHDETITPLELSLARSIYPPSSFSEDAAKQMRTALAMTDVAQPAIGAASMGMYSLVRQLGLHADVMAGHSYGEYTALWASGSINRRDFIRLSYRRGELLRAAAGESSGGMAAVTADAQTVEKALGQLDSITLANLNAPDQTVISGSHDALDEAITRLEAQQIKVQKLRVSCAFHSPEVSSAQEQFSVALSEAEIVAAETTVFANKTARAYGDDPAAIRETLCSHITSPVQFRSQIEAMYESGVRTFVEVGPHNHLTGLVKRNLTDRPHTAVSTDVASRNGLTQLQHCLAQLLMANVPLDLGALYANRANETFAPSALASKAATVEYSPMTHIINGVRSRPWKAEEPRLLGQASQDALPKRAAPHEPQTPTQSPIQQPIQQTPNSVPTTNDNVKVAMKSTPDSTAGPPPQNGQAPHPLENGVASNGHAHGVVSSHSAHGLQNVDPVLLGFQELMSQFLDTQRDIMLQYLGSDPSQQAPTNGALTSGHAPGSPAPAVSAAGPIPTQPMTAQPMPAQPATTQSTPAQSTPAQSTPPSAPVPPPSVATNGAVASGSATNGAVSEAPAGETIEQITARLLEIVSERTGYPTEMLDVDLDLEADLGIDSIKRVEILGELAEGIDAGEADESALELEKLTTKRTLRGMLEYLESALFSHDGRDGGDAIVNQLSPSESAPSGDARSRSAPSKNGSGHAPPTDHAQANGHVVSSRGAVSTVQVYRADTVAPANGPVGTELPSCEQAGTEQVQRGCIRLVDVKLPAASSPVIPSGTVIITDDGRGLAVELADQLGDFGQSVHVVRHTEDSNGEVRSKSGLIYADLKCPEQVQQVVDQVRAASGPIAGLIHLLPLSTSEAPWQQTARRDTRSLYLLARALEEDLNGCGDGGNAMVLAATAMGGRLGFSTDLRIDSFSAGQGGVLGFAKCFAMECPDVMVRAIDTNPSQSVGDLIEVLLGELRDPEGPLEVGHDGERRVTWEPFAAPLETNHEPKIDIDSDSVILLTGGARGITAAIGTELAKRFRPTLILAGRSELTDEPEATTALQTAAEMKRALMSMLFPDGSPKMAEVESAYKQIMRCREMRANIAAMETAGSTVEYHSVDVRDEAAVEKLIQQVKSKHAGIHGVIHGAGVIEDKLVRDKTPKSFDRVFGTKVESAAHFVKHLPQDSLQFMSLFSSVASRYGNRGQSDYAAANEVLSKLAAELDGRWDARVFAIAWGPWSSIGMVSNLESHLTARGITLISPDEGSDHLIQEILHGAKGASEVMIAGGANNLVTPTTSKASN